MSRETQRCPKCRMAQFVSAKRVCLRCHAALKQATVVIAPAPAPVPQPPVPMADTIGARVRAMRSGARMTQKAVGKAAGQPRQYICKVERGVHQPTVASLQRIAAALGCDIRVLLPGIPDPALDVILAVVQSCLPRLSRRDREVLLETARKMAEAQNHPTGNGSMAS